MQRVGSRRQVWNRTAKQTTGGLTRSEIFQDKYGNLKSKKASKKAKLNKTFILKFNYEISYEGAQLRCVHTSRVMIG